MRKICISNVISNETKFKLNQSKEVNVFFSRLFSEEGEERIKGIKSGESVVYLDYFKIPLWYN